ncbi:MAG TPA: hypothetical protein DCE23_09050 [Firmicutes bacterium]|nr:hypothetical protein [Bacillota bacterium]
MKRRLLLFMVLLCFPVITLAKESENILAQEIKYYKTTTINKGTISVMSNSLGVNTVEISKEEYESSNSNNIMPNTIIETEYKKMTTTISKVNSNYRYKVNLEWKNIPKIRSYDTIAIGFPSSVKPKMTPIFSEEYCNSSGCHNTSGYHYMYSGKNGVGVTFQVPSGDLKSMNQTLYVDMEKNTSSTIITQYAYGDYAHAVKSISLGSAKNYTVSTIGIKYDSSNISYYDEINYARATWNGNW